jgi:uncharacterized cupredoxin-like copper-binding protein
MPRILLAAAAIAALAVAGCGSSSSTTSTASTSTAPAAAATTTTAATTSSTPATTTAASGTSKLSIVPIAANPSGMLMFTSNTLAAKAGKVAIVFTNKSSLAHNFTLATTSGTVLGATPTFAGGTKTLTLTLKAGTYTYYCSVPGHRAAGMQGKLVVS